MLIGTGVTDIPTDDYTHFSGAAISEVANFIRTSVLVPFVLTSLSRRIVRARRPGASASSGSQLAMKPCEMFLWHCLRETLYGIRYSLCVAFSFVVLPSLTGLGIEYLRASGQ